MKIGGRTVKSQWCLFVGYCEELHEYALRVNWGGREESRGRDGLIAYRHGLKIGFPIRLGAKFPWATYLRTDRRASA